MFDSIGRIAEDVIQNFFWMILKPLFTLINSLLDSLFNGVLSLDVFANNEFIATAFKCSLALMFIIIPAKIVYEIVTSMVKDDDAGLDFQKKLGSAFLGIVIACSLTFAVTQVINPLVKDTTQILLGINTSENSLENVQVGDTLIETVLVSFGGMQKGGEYGADSFVQAYNDGDLNIVERYEQDEGTHKKYDYKWDFSLFMTIIGVAIYVILLFVITIQIAVRMISIGFYYLIGPLCCTSLTNYQNPQAFNVWKATILGQYAQTLTQIFLLSMMVSLLDSIAEASSGYPIASCALYFGAFSLVLSAPNFVQAMIGGYSSGILDSINSMRGGFGLAKGIVAGAIGGAIGRMSPHTGHLMGGLRGAVAGNMRTDGTRQGGIKGAVMGTTQSVNGIKGRAGGLRGALMGNDQLSQGANNTTVRTRSGGVAGAFRGSTVDTSSHGGQLLSTTHKPRFSTIRGSTTTDFNPETGEPISTTHNPSPIQQRVSSLNNRMRNMGTNSSSASSMNRMNKKPPFSK